MAARRVLRQNILGTIPYTIPRGRRGTSTEHRAPRRADRPLGARASRPPAPPACSRYADAGLPIAAAPPEPGHAGRPAPAGPPERGRLARFATNRGRGGHPRPAARGPRERGRLALGARPSRPLFNEPHQEADGPVRAGQGAAGSLTGGTRPNRPSPTARCATTPPNGCGRACRTLSVDAAGGRDARVPRNSLQAQYPGPCSRISGSFHGADRRVLVDRVIVGVRYEYGIIKV
jgi:hypothetical protein